jgi:hypothetical protein
MRREVLIEPPLDQTNGLHCELERVDGLICHARVEQLALNFQAPSNPAACADRRLNVRAIEPINPDSENSTVNGGVILRYPQTKYCYTPRMSLPLAAWIAGHVRVESGVIDGEIACVDEAGRPVFRDLLY